MRARPCTPRSARRSHAARESSASANAAGSPGSTRTPQPSTSSTDRADAGCDDGRCGRHGFHERHRDSVAVTVGCNNARQCDNGGAADQLSHRCLVALTHEAHAADETRVLDRKLERTARSGPSPTINTRHGFAAYRDRLDQHIVALLRNERPDGNYQMRVAGLGRHG